MHRARKHPRVVPALITTNDPNDDAVGNDPVDDDDEEDGLDDPIYDDTSAPTTVWLQEVVPYLVTSECASVTWATPPCSSFLTRRALRC
jgi:hypothetical protein